MYTGDAALQTDALSVISLSKNNRAVKPQSLFQIVVLCVVLHTALQVTGCILLGYSDALLSLWI